MEYVSYPIYNKTRRMTGPAAECTEYIFSNINDSIRFKTFKVWG